MAEIRWIRTDELVAAAFGHLEMRSGCEKHGAACGGGHLDVLKWMCDMEYAMEEHTESAVFVARCGKLEVLKWLRQRG